MDLCVGTSNFFPHLYFREKIQQDPWKHTTIHYPLEELQIFWILILEIHVYNFTYIIMYSICNHIYSSNLLKFFSANMLLHHLTQPPQPNPKGTFSSVYERLQASKQVALTATLPETSSSPPENRPLEIRRFHEIPIGNHHFWGLKKWCLENIGKYDFF